VEHELEVMVSDPTSLTPALVGEDGRLKDRIDVADGVSLSPLFTSIRKAGAVGGAEVLTFIYHVPVGLVVGVAAAALYDWIKARGIRRMRVNGHEVAVTEKPAETVPVIEQALKQ